jgi:hypothetical protein
VSTSFECVDGTDGLGISSCVDSEHQVSPGLLDTSSPGPHTYSVEAISSDGLATGDSIAYTVDDAPVITSNPVSQTAYAGTTLTFSANAAGTPSPTVQWQVSTNQGKSWTNYSPAMTTSLTTKALTVAENNWEVRAVFTNPMGTVTTTAATITVLRDVAPKVTTQPTGQSVAPGATATFTAAASGAPTPAVQWQVSTNGGITWTNVSGFTSRTVSVTATTSENGWKVRAVFTNGGGAAITSAATLKVT